MKKKSEEIMIFLKGLLSQGLHCKWSEREVPCCRVGRFPWLRQGLDLGVGVTLC